MSLRISDVTQRRDEKWLEKSLVAPSPTLLYERSDGEKAASEHLIQEKAKTEQWNRELSKALFAIRLSVLLLPPAFVLGVGVGIWIAKS